ncbi:MAG: pentapeptide repeat-containing protein [Bacteroidales bacterium]|jgi:hypothetical protein|nr:pentapeptide repeat-containing protein [Bacteroidales bacterium]
MNICNWHWTIWTALGVIAFAWMLWCFDNKLHLLRIFFSKNKKPVLSDVMKYAGAAAGGLLIIGNFLISKTQTDLIAKGQLDTRFKDAAMLLANDNTSAMLSGVAALHQIAVEASQNEDQKDYVQVIKDILINFIKEGSTKELNDGKIALEKDNKKPILVVQTIIDKLYSMDKKNRQMYKSAHLSSCVLKGIIFQHAHLEDVSFSHANLENSMFYNVHLEGADFCCARLEGAYFRGAFINKETNFIGTIYADLSYEDLLQKLGAFDAGKVKPTK